MPHEQTPDTEFGYAPGWAEKLSAAEEEERFWLSLDAEDPDDAPHGHECGCEDCLQRHPERDEEGW
jgi:hypothetical protein